MYHEASLTKYALLPLLLLLAFSSACSLKSATDELEVQPVPIAGGYIRNPGKIRAVVSGGNIQVTGDAGAIEGTGAVVIVHQVSSSTLDQLVVDDSDGDESVVKKTLTFAGREQVTAGSDGAFSLTLPASVVTAGFGDPSITSAQIIVSVRQSANQAPNEVFLSRSTLGRVLAVGGNVTQAEGDLQPLVLPSGFSGSDWFLPREIGNGFEKLTTLFEGGTLAGTIDSNGNRYTAWYGTENNGLMIVRTAADGTQLTFEYNPESRPTTVRPLRIAASGRSALLCAPIVLNAEYELHCMAYEADGGWQALEPIDVDLQGSFDILYVNDTDAVVLHAKQEGAIAKPAILKYSAHAWHSPQILDAAGYDQIFSLRLVAGPNASFTAIAGVSDLTNVKLWARNFPSGLGQSPASSSIHTLSTVPVSGVEQATLGVDGDAYGNVYLMTRDFVTRYLPATQSWEEPTPLPTAPRTSDFGVESKIQVSADGSVGWAIWHDEEAFVTYGIRWTGASWDTDPVELFSDPLSPIDFEMSSYGDAVLIGQYEGELRERRYIHGTGWGTERIIRGTVEGMAYPISGRLSYANVTVGNEITGVFYATWLYDNNEAFHSWLGTPDLGGDSGDLGRDGGSAGGSGGGDGGSAGDDGSGGIGGDSGDGGSAGDVSSGDASSGDMSSGDMSSGDMSSGDMSSGDMSSGDMSSGDMSSGDMSSGDMSSGDMSSGDMSSGDMSSGDMSSGDMSSGDMSSGDMSSGDMSSGDMSSGDMSAGDMSSGDGLDERDGVGNFKVNGSKEVAPDQNPIPDGSLVGQ